MKIEDHEKSYNEHRSNLKRLIEEGIENNQRNIGYNISQGSVELFAIYLHRLRVLQGSGDMFNHRIFKNKNLIERKIPFEFKDKDKILELMKEIELDRNIVCYGKRKPIDKIKNMINKVNGINRIILHGSVARGDYVEDSDVDLFVDAKKNIEKEVNKALENYPKTKKFQEWKFKGIENEISIIIGNLESREWRDLKRSMMNTGIILFGKYKPEVEKVNHYVIFSFEN